MVSESESAASLSPDWFVVVSDNDIPDNDVSERYTPNVFAKAVHSMEEDPGLTVFMGKPGFQSELEDARSQRSGRPLLVLPARDQKFMVTRLRMNPSEDTWTMSIFSATPGGVKIYAKATFEGSTDDGIYSSTFAVWINRVDSAAQLTRAPSIPYFPRRREAAGGRPQSPDWEALGAIRRQVSTVSPSASAVSAADRTLPGQLSEGAGRFLSSGRARKGAAAHASSSSRHDRQVETDLAVLRGSGRSSHEKKATREPTTPATWEPADQRASHELQTSSPRDRATSEISLIFKSHGAASEELSAATIKARIGNQADESATSTFGLHNYTMIKRVLESKYLEDALEETAMHTQKIRGRTQEDDDWRVELFVPSAGRNPIKLEAARMTTEQLQREVELLADPSSTAVCGLRTIHDPKRSVASEDNPKSYRTGWRRLPPPPGDGKWPKF